MNNTKGNEPWGVVFARSINDTLIKPTEIRLGVKLCRDGAQIPRQGTNPS